MLYHEIDCNNLEPPEISEETVTILEQKEYRMFEILDKLKKYFVENNVDQEIKDKTVMLKVSLVFPVGDYERVIMINTNYNLIAATARALEDLGAKKIYIADGETIGSASYAFRVTKLKRWLNRMDLKQTEYLFLDEVPRVKIHFKGSTLEDAARSGDYPFEDLELSYPACLISDRTLKKKNGEEIPPDQLQEKYGYIDYFISMPKLKANIFANITLSVKNNMGIIPRGERLKYHSRILHDMIAYLYTIRVPDLVITDAIVSGMGQGPMEADPCNSEMLIIGRVGTAVDTVSAYLMDHDPLKVRHLKLLKDWGYGSLEMGKIDIENREILEEKRDQILPFHLPDRHIEDIPGLKVYITEETCDAGCRGMMKAILDAYLKNGKAEALKGHTFILGDVEIPDDELAQIDKSKTVVYGDCAKRYKKYGAYYGGCPPDYLYAMAMMEIQAHMGINPWVVYVKPIHFIWEYIRHLTLRLLGVRLWKSI